ncbi:DsbA family oxidoreductase [Caldibacillus lycopersici]|uniref:DsbA family oxidoreductase n=1 Tax=Perspicuibacillus lycopersici TaxID=1325689 RepID=A0AAE3IQ38_9BACI|nr:DsbA family oxidoreductase [Perspicuibacillus lycopersici]MCU9612352.1 DsbA family oxidoreductase [Perspicuibacillus lycopersici]
MKIEIWSDFVCPFCYMGKRRLENAMEQFAHRNEIEVEYKSYQLDPEAKHIEGMNFYETFSKLKGFPLEQTIAMNKQVAQQASTLQLTYNFDTMKYANTFDAHRVAKYAAEKGKGKEATERFLYAYFTESKLISDHETLIELAGEIGLDKEEVAEVLASDRYAQAVHHDIRQAYQIGVQGVPFFVFNRKYAISGAQPETVFLQTLEKVWEEETNVKPVLQTLNPTGADAGVCTDEGCEIKK